MIPKYAHKILKIFKDKKGFSLIELLVSFTLITMVSGIGLASFVTYSRSQIVTQAAANLRQETDVARFNAISFVKPEVCAGENLSSYRVRFCQNGGCFSGNSDYELTVFCGAEILMKSNTLPDNVVLENVDGSTNCTLATYSIGSGIVSGVPCVVNIAGYGNTVTLTLDSTGNASY